MQPTWRDFLIQMALIAAAMGTGTLIGAIHKIYPVAAGVLVALFVGLVGACIGGQFRKYLRGALIGIAVYACLLLATLFFERVR